jgi:hypothetical protein
MTQHIPLVTHQGGECLVLGEAEVNDDGITTKLVVMVSTAVLEALSVNKDMFALVPKCE